VLKHYYWVIINKKVFVKNKKFYQIYNKKFIKYINFLILDLILILYQYTIFKLFIFKKNRFDYRYSQFSNKVYIYLNILKKNKFNLNGIYFF
jgi:hypothetical protein